MPDVMARHRNRAYQLTKRLDVWERRSERRGEPLPVAYYSTATELAAIDKILAADNALNDEFWRRMKSIPPLRRIHPIGDK